MGYIDASRWDAFYQWLWDNQLIEDEIRRALGLPTTICRNKDSWYEQTRSGIYHQKL